MSDSAFTATFSDLRTVKTRGVVSLHFEVSIEQADHALAILGGLPKHGAEVHVAIARLQKAPADARPKETPEASPQAQHHPGRSEAARERYAMQDEMAKARDRCAILCNDERFQSWLGVPSADLAAKAVRSRLAGCSRSFIATDERVYRTFLALETEYKIATGQFAEARG